MGKVVKKLLARLSSFSYRAKHITLDGCSMLCIQTNGGAACSYQELPGEVPHGSSYVKSKVRKGCVPVLVNGEHRLLFNASRLSHPLLASLLHQTAKEMGYKWDYPGALRLSCDPASFHYVLCLAKGVSKKEAICKFQHSEQIRHLSINKTVAHPL